MTFVTVFRHVPRPITGMIGVLCDRAFEAFEANLDWDSWVVCGANLSVVALKFPHPTP